MPSPSRDPGAREARPPVPASNLPPALHAGVCGIECIRRMSFIAIEKARKMHNSVRVIIMADTASAQPHAELTETETDA